MVRVKSSSTADSLTHTIVIPKAQTSPNERWLKVCSKSKHARSELLQAFGERRISWAGMDAEQTKVQLLRIPE